MKNENGVKPMKKGNFQLTHSVKKSDCFAFFIHFAHNIHNRRVGQIGLPEAFTGPTKMRVR
jgi:hypothetical protein